jgi:CheY-like chemotaxis protein
MRGPLREANVLQLGAILEIDMAQILIAGKDWTSRALLRAQLIEEGFEVEAYEDVQEVVDRLWGSADMPSLLIVDLFESGVPAEDVAMLSHWAKLLPIWVMAGHETAGSRMLEGQGFERVLFRPVDVGKLVQEIKQRLEG